jgi:hypothetical protein
MTVFDTLVGIDPMAKNGKSSSFVRYFFTIGIKQE